MRRGLLACLVVFGLTGEANAETALAPIELRVDPVTHFLNGSDQTKFGALEFRGGLVLSSRDGRFGSLSGLDFGPDGKTIYAIADTGYWFEAELVETDGRLTSVSDPLYGPFLLENGAPPASKVTADAEGLRIVERNGVPTALVSFEQTPAVRIYAGPDFTAATPTAIALPAFVKGIPRNKGLETIAVAPVNGPLAGAIVVVAEHAPDKAGNHRGFILSGQRKGIFAIRASGGYDISDGVFLSDGDLLILERQFSFSQGFAVRIRRIAGSAIAPGATVDGPVLMEADSRYQIDNLEGMAVRTTDAGETLITLVSDNNDNIFQRTLLLEFALTGAGPPLPHARPQ